MTPIDAPAIRTILRLEGLAAFGAGIAAYAWLGGSWGMALALALLPDLSMAAYALGPRAGARAYNLAHTYALPALLALGGLALPALLPLAALWAAHIGIDRALGYGLKSDEGFGVTHLGRIGRRRQPASAS